jgi:hypothetical protein
METTMELDELKSAWQALDRHLQQQTALNRIVFREGKLDKVRASLRTLYWGKIVQILFGDALIYFGIMSTIRYHATPHLLACSVSMLAYGLLIVVFGGVIIGKVSSIDYAAPVLEIQKRVGALHRLYILGNQCAGLPWWLLWIAIFVLEVQANLDIDLFVRAPLFVATSAAVGLTGVLGSLCLRYLARDPRRQRLADFIDGGMTGASLRKARGLLAEIERFERT